MGQSIRADHGLVYLLPQNLDDWVDRDDPVRYIHEFVQGLDLGKLGVKTRAVGKAGTDHYGADLLLGVWLYGYYMRIRSSRKLEAAVRTQLPFIWLAGTHRPDHSTLWRFWSANKDLLAKVFKQTVLVADGLGMVELALVAVDGTKLQASSSKRFAWSRKTLEEKEAELDAAIKEIEAAVGADTSAEASPVIPERLARKRELREGIREQLKRLDEGGRNHMHPGEPDARMMQFPRSSDIGYNAQAVADSRSQVVVAAVVTTDENDLRQLVPMIGEVVANLDRVPEETLADAGYASDAQFAMAEELGYPVLTPGGPAAPVEQERPKAGHFLHDPDTGVVTCPQTGTELRFERERKRTKADFMIKLYRCKNSACPLRDKCSKDPRGRSVEIAPNRGARKRQSEKRAGLGMAEKARARAGIIEPVFAQLKQNDEFRRFTFKGIEGVSAQWSMLMAAHNLRKIFRWMQAQAAAQKAA